MSEERTDENRIDWERRFYDPMVRLKWNSEIRVDPADHENGKHIGHRYFPDGTKEQFYVE